MPDGETHGLPERWSWVETAVWTPRMVAALETGVKGGRWYSLMDKVTAPRTLAAAWTRVQRNRGAAGVDRQSVTRFDAHAERYLGELHDALRTGTYQPQSVKRVWIDKPGRREQRPLGIPTVKDRIVQTALRYVLEPIAEQTFAEQSYGFRPGRGCKDALRRVETLLQAGATWVVDVDLAQYFDTIPHDRLLTAVETLTADRQILRLVEQYLAAQVLDGMTVWQPHAGTPQGAVISPLLANLYLSPLDHHMGAQGWEMVRYADDFVVLCQSQAEADAALVAIQGWVEANGLRLHPEKTRVVDLRERGGFDFLGYHFERQSRWPKRESQQRYKRAIKATTRRSSGESMDVIIAQINPITRGWYAYYRHGNPNVYRALDGYVRGRLRSILRKRAGRRGRERRPDHWRYPNTYFDAQGLFTMVAARRAAGYSR